MSEFLRHFFYRDQILHSCFSGSKKNNRNPGFFYFLKIVFYATPYSLIGHFISKEKSGSSISFIFGYCVLFGVPNIHDKGFCKVCNILPDIVNLKLNFRKKDHILRIFISAIITGTKKRLPHKYTQKIRKFNKIQHI